MALAAVPSITPLVVIAHDDPGTADSLRHAVEALAGWQVMVADPGAGELTAALAAAPLVALVGCGALANLPPDCPTPLVAIGDDDRPADVRAALAAGARSLLAWPDGAADLPGELARVAATGRPDLTGDPGGLVVATRGVQGGAGTTTVAIHLAAAWARWGPAPVLLLDLAGGIAFRLDLSSAPTWSSLLAPAGPVPALAGPGGLPTASGSLGASGLQMDATPDAGAFLGTLAEPWAGLSVLPLSGLVDGVSDPPPDPSPSRACWRRPRPATAWSSSTCPPPTGLRSGPPCPWPMPWSPSAAARPPVSAAFRRPSRPGRRPVATPTPRAPWSPASGPRLPSPPARSAPPSETTSGASSPPPPPSWPRPPKTASSSSTATTSPPSRPW